MSAALEERLFSLRDEKYRAFHTRLIPTVDPETVLGIRVPALRKLAGSLQEEERESLLTSLPHRYYEENCLHGFLIQQIKDYDRCVAELNRFLPYVDNWAVCDMTAPRALGKELHRLATQCRLWLASGHTYTQRFAILTMMRYLLSESLEEVAGLRSQEYYVNMAIAWFFAEGLVKHYDQTLPYLLNHRLSPWIHNKAIQKARESNRISPEQKQYLQTLRATATPGSK